MSLVQGIGDEVLVFFMFMFLLIAVLIVIALRALRSGGSLTGGNERRGVETEGSRLGYNGAGEVFEDSGTAYDGTGRAPYGSRTASVGATGSAFEDSMTASDVAGRVSEGSRARRMGMDEVSERLHDTARSHTNHNAVTHSSSSDRGELRRRVPKGTAAAAHMEPSRLAEEKASLGNIWEAAERVDSGQEPPPSCVNGATSPPAEVEAHEAVPTPEPPEQETSDGLSISLVHLQQRTQINCSPDDTLAHLAEVHFAHELRDNVRARFIYCGRLLDAEAPVRDHHLPPEAGIHIHFSRGGGTHPTQATGGMGPAVLDISALFLPLMGVVLCAVWAVLLWKPVLFTLLTKLMLYFLSFGFVLMLYARFGQRANPARL